MNSTPLSTDAAPYPDRTSSPIQANDQPRSWSVASLGSFVATAAAASYAIAAAAAAVGIHLVAAGGTAATSAVHTAATACKLVTLE